MMKTWQVATIIALILVMLSAWYIAGRMSTPTETTTPTPTETPTLIETPTITPTAVPGVQANRVDFVFPNGSASTVYVEVADNEQAWEQGLMNRTSLAADRGMLFVFNLDSRQSFWMKDTPLPLDMVFIASNLTIVDINHDAIPYSETVFTSHSACRYVVEVNGGYCKEHDIQIGDKVHMIYSISPTA